MSRRVEGLEITVLAKPAQSRIRRGFEKFFSLVPNMGKNPYPDRSVVIPRAPGATGTVTDAQEAQEILAAVQQLFQQVPPDRQAVLPSGEINPACVVVRRVRQVERFQSLTFHTPSRHERYPVIRGDVTESFNHTYQSARIHSVPLNAYSADGEIVKAATNVMDILKQHGISASQENVQRLIVARLGSIHKALQLGRLEKLLSKFPSGLISAINVPTHMGGIDLNKAARDIALEGQLYGAVSGKQPEVGFFGQILGGIEFTAGLIEAAGFAEIADSVTDFLIGKIYQHVKYPTQRIFQRHVEHTSTNRVIEIAGAIPILPAATTLWAFQMAGRKQLRERLAKHDPDIHRQLVTIAAEAVTNDFSRLNQEHK